MPAGSAQPRAGRISTGRKLLYGLLVLALVLGLAEAGARWLTRQRPPPPMPMPSMAAYLGSMQGRAELAHYQHRDGDLPGAQGPRVLLRVAPGTPGSQAYPGPGGAYSLARPSSLDGRPVLVLGASAAYGDGVRQPDTLAARLQRLLARRGAGAPRVLNLARPAWELNSVAWLLRRLLRQMPRPPRAVVLMAGNNEFLVPPFHGVGWAGYRRLGLHRLLSDWMSRRGWLRPPPGMDYGRFKNPRWGVVAPPSVAGRVWRPPRGVPDASHWPDLRRIYLQRYRRTLTQLATELARRKVPLVLVAPPVNLQLFPAAIQPQPAGLDALGPGGYEALRRRLERALTDADRSALERLVKQAPGGPIQRYLVAQQLDRAGQHRRALAQLTRARDDMMGYLSALPAMGRIVEGLASRPGVRVVTTQGWYRGQMPVGKRSKMLFVDACHPSALGHQLLAVAVAARLD